MNTVVPDAFPGKWKKAVIILRLLMLIVLLLPLSGCSRQSLAVVGDPLFIEKILGGKSSGMVKWQTFFKEEINVTFHSIPFGYTDLVGSTAELDEQNILISPSFNPYLSSLAEIYPEKSFFGFSFLDDLPADNPNLNIIKLSRLSALSEAVQYIAAFCYDYEDQHGESANVKILFYTDTVNRRIEYQHLKRTVELEGLNNCVSLEKLTFQGDRGRIQNHLESISSAVNLWGFFLGDLNDAAVQFAADRNYDIITENREGSGISPDSVLGSVEINYDKLFKSIISNISKTGVLGEIVEAEFNSY